MCGRIVQMFHKITTLGVSVCVDALDVILDSHNCSREQTNKKVYRHTLTHSLTHFLTYNHW